MVKRDIPYWRLSAFYLFYFASLGVLVPYWSLYLKSLGHSSLAIGGFTKGIVRFDCGRRCGRRQISEGIGLWRRGWSRNWCWRGCRLGRRRGPKRILLRRDGCGSAKQVLFVCRSRSLVYFRPGTGWKGLRRRRLRFRKRGSLHWRWRRLRALFLKWTRWREGDSVRSGRPLISIPRRDPQVPGGDVPTAYSSPKA